MNKETDSVINTPPITKGITVQTLGMDPHSETKFLQVHNRLEAVIPGMPVISMYGSQSKPPAYGNPGGGMEPDELERFKKNEPKWYAYYSSLGTLSQSELEIIGCAFRETKDESGYDDFEVLLDEDTGKLIMLTDYRYREGHRVVTVWGKFNSYHHREFIREADEIDDVEWIDFSMSMTEVFRRLRRKLQGEFPVYPYWSHVRRIGCSLPVIDRYKRDREELYCPIGRLIHPSWRTVFRVGRGDDRFPAGGYLISPVDWYHMFDIMIEKGIEYLDNDTLLSEFDGRSEVKILTYDSNGNPGVKERVSDLNLSGKIRLAKEHQDVAVNDLAGSEDQMGIPTSAEIIKAEDEQYAKWYEQSLPQHLRVMT